MVCSIKFFFFAWNPSHLFGVSINFVKTKIHKNHGKLVSSILSSNYLIESSNNQSHNCHIKKLWRKKKCSLKNHPSCSTPLTSYHTRFVTTRENRNICTNFLSTCGLSRKFSVPILYVKLDTTHSRLFYLQNVQLISLHALKTAYYINSN